MLCPLKRILLVFKSPGNPSKALAGQTSDQVTVTLYTVDGAVGMHTCAGIHASRPSVGEPGRRGRARDETQLPKACPAPPPWAPAEGGGGRGRQGPLGAPVLELNPHWERIIRTVLFTSSN